MASAQRQADRLVRDLKIDWSHAAPTDALISVGSDSASNALNTFGLSATLDADIFDAVNRNTVDWAVDHATDLITLVSDSTKELIRSSVVRALEEGWTVQQLKQNIVDGYIFSDDRASVIAGDQVTNAANQGGFLAARGAGMDRKSWIASDGACADCRANEGVGNIDINDQFPSGHGAPNAHPGDQCSMSYSVTDETDSSDEEDSSDEAHPTDEAE